MGDNRTKFYISTFQDHSKEMYLEGLNLAVIYKKAKLCPFIKPDRSIFLFSKYNRFRILLRSVAESKLFETLILLAICASCIVMALFSQLPQSGSNSLNNKLEQSEIYFIIIFLFECIIKIISYGFVLHKGSYLRNGWNILDFTIVVIGLVSYIATNINASSKVDIKALRAFRVLRPLRLVSNIPSLQIVLTSIIWSMIPLANVALLILFLLIVYSIIGMDLFMGKLHATCYNNVTFVMMDNPNPCRLDEGVTGYYCTGLNALPSGQSWVCMDFKNNSQWPGPNYGITNYDNMALAMLTVLQIITKSGWTSYMYSINDTMGTEWPWIYFISLVIIIAFCVLSLILAVLSGEYCKQSALLNERNRLKKDRRTIRENSDYMGYKSWIEFAENLDELQKQSLPVFIDEDVYKDFLDNSSESRSNDIKEKSLKIKFSNLYRSFYNYRVRLQKSLRALVKGKIFFTVILALVFLNTVIMATEYTNQPHWLGEFQDKANLIFVIFFTLEVVAKLFALGPKNYFSKLFNIFDFIVIFISIAELILIASKVINPVGLSVLRCARLLRVFKLTTSWDNLRTLIRNMLRSIRSILSLLILLALFIIIFSLLGMQIFGGKFGTVNAPRAVFDTFYNSFFTVFQIITGDWNYVLFSGINAYQGIYSPGNAIAIYFVVLFIVGNFILLNVFVAIAVNSLKGNDGEEDVDDDESRTNETDDQLLLQNIDKEAKSPILTDRLVVVNGCAMLPPKAINDIVSINKIKKRGRKRQNLENRVKINFEVEEIVDELEELEPPLGKITYNELFAEDDFNIELDEKPPIPTLIPKPEDFKRLKEKVVPLPTAASFFIFKDTNIFRIKCYQLVNHSLLKNMILVCIIMSSIMLAAQDPINDNSGRNKALKIFDYIFTGIFSIEILIKMISYGVILHKNSYLREPFNWLDFIVVLIGIIDSSLPSDITNTGMSAVKTLRVVRVLRPLRTINRAKGLKHVLHCVFVALKTIWKIMVITFLLEFMFAVIGVIIMKGAFYSCNDPSMTTNTTCIGNFTTGMTVTTRIWSNYPFNYDNVINGMLTLFVVASLSGWATILYKSIDATNENQGPILNNNPYIFLYYLVFIILIAFIMINLILGMVIVTFQKEGDAEYAKYKLDKNKRECINFALKCRPVIRYIPNEIARYKVWRFVTSSKFEYFIIVLILLNTILLAANYFNQPPSYTSIIQILNISLTVLFTIECILKMYAFNFRNFFNDSMNIFDIIVIVGGFVDLVFYSIETGTDTVRINLFRLFRVFRLIRLFVKIQSLRRLLWTFIKSFQSLPYVMLLILLTFFIYAVMGMQFFGKIALDNSGSAITRNNNFQTIYNSFLVLFRCLTDDGWELIMLSCIYDPIAPCLNSTAICGSAVSYVYFISFIMICYFVILNLFITVIINNFDYLTRDNSILGCSDLEHFITIWSQYDVEGRGRIKHVDIINMLSRMNPPLGFGKLCPQVRAFRNLIKLNMPLQTDGSILFNATLFSLVRKSLKIKYSDSAAEKQTLKQYNDELRTILKTYWKHTNPLLLDQIIPPNIYESVTIGKFYATLIIENWYKKCMINKMLTKEHKPILPQKKPLVIKPKLTVKIETSSTSNDSSTSLSNALIKVSDINNIYEDFSNKVWSTLTDIFTIPEDNDTKY